MILTRRTFFGLLAAPAVVKAVSLMPISAWVEPLALRSPLVLKSYGYGWNVDGKPVFVGGFSIDGVLMTKEYLVEPSGETQIIVPSKPDWGPSAPPEFALPYVQRREAMLRRIWPTVRAEWISTDRSRWSWEYEGLWFRRYPNCVMCGDVVLEQWL